MESEVLGFTIRAHRDWTCSYQVPLKWNLVSEMLGVYDKELEMDLHHFKCATSELMNLDLGVYTKSS